MAEIHRVVIRRAVSLTIGTTFLTSILPAMIQIRPEVIHRAAISLISRGIRRVESRRATFRAVVV